MNIIYVFGKLSVNYDTNHSCSQQSRSFAIIWVMAITLSPNSHLGQVYFTHKSRERQKLRTDFDKIKSIIYFENILNNEMENE